MKQVILILLSFFFSSLTMAAQSCLSNFSETSPESDFTLDDSLGTALDTTTGLMWSRCALGQSWNADSSTCTGSRSQLNWQQALETTYNSRYADYNDWRMPNIKELMTIIERQCAQPSINTSVFIDATNDEFWSSTTQSLEYTEAWVVAFYNGTNTNRDKVLKLFTRLVRTAD